MSRAAPVDYQAILRDEARRGRAWRWTTRGLGALALIAILGVSFWKAKISPVDFFRRLPKLGEWLARFWPPDFTDLWTAFVPSLIETVAISIAGTALSFLVAFPLAICVARNTTPSRWLALPVRGLLNVLRAIDTATFAILFVALVGLGPFAGVLGMVFHTSGSMAKLFAEALETVSPETLEAVEATGAGRLRTFFFAVLPEAMPSLASITLYLWEFSVRGSVVLGIVGAGGIGYELRISVQLMDFARLSAILIIILVAVTVIDATSAWLRRVLR